MNHQESFINHFKYEKRYSSHTVKAYKNDLDQFVQFCTDSVGEFNVKKVDGKSSKKLDSLFNGERISARSINRKITTLKVIL